MDERFITLISNGRKYGLLLIGTLATIRAFVSVLALLVLAVTRLVNAVRKLMEATGFSRGK